VTKTLNVTKMSRTLRLAPITNATRYQILEENPADALIKTLANRMEFKSILCVNSNIVPLFSHSFDDFGKLSTFVDHVMTRSHHDMLLIVENAPVVWIDILVYTLNPKYLIVRSIEKCSTVFDYQLMQTFNHSILKNMGVKWDAEDMKHILKYAAVDVNRLEYILVQNVVLNLTAQLNAFIHQMRQIRPTC